MAQASRALARCPRHSVGAAIGRAKGVADRRSLTCVMGWNIPHVHVPAIHLPTTVKFWKKSAHLKDFERQLESDIGKISLSGRYHRFPRQIGDDYQISKHVLGRGYSGEVKMATYAGPGHAGQKVAVKVLRLDHIAASKVEQLKSEVENFLRMDHPHITRLYDVYESKDSLSLVMECMEGGELFDRISEKKRFSEEDASHALWQMLLALNYIHSHGIVHRDIKLENFLYDALGSRTLKLIDFGFSKMVDDPAEKMSTGLGTIAYVAPEVLKHSYTSQCDLWSLGVISFILISGYMPFTGTGQAQVKKILSGQFKLKPERWQNVSTETKGFVQSLLEVDPGKRLTAKAALQHPWIARHHRCDGKVDAGVVKALQQFGHVCKFRRCCMEIMAWSLTNEQRAKVCEYFYSLDTSSQGTISLAELRRAMKHLGISDEAEVQNVFEALDSNQDHEIHYSDFLAAMVSTKIELDDELMRSTFKKFDTNSSGFITSENVRDILGDTFEGEHVEELMEEAGFNDQDGICYGEFEAFLKRTSTPIPSGEDRRVDHAAREGGSPSSKLGCILREISTRFICGATPSRV
uniref:Calmodulin n=1 Tax=Alexandrium monilatum TaxID=311494 RepID=A0A7S4RVJ5_9DINO